MERFDDEAVRRILARARQEDDESDRERGIEADALVAAAEEVGYDPDAVRDSIALERFEPPPAGGALDRWSGESQVLVQRLVHRPVDEVLDVATEWLERAHRMVCRRVDDSTLSARRRAGLSASVGRSMTDLRGDGRLGRMAAVRVVAVPLTGTPDRPHRTMVQLTADRTAQRQQRLVAGGLLGGTGVATAAVGIAESMFAWPVAAVVFGGAGAVTVASGRRHADRVEADLDALLVAVEADAPVGTFRRVARAARRGVGR